MTEQTLPPPIPVGVREIAARAGVTEIAVRKWVERHDNSATPFPRSVGTVSGRPAYWWHDAVDWLATTGRLARVTRLERPDEYGLVTHHMVIQYQPVHRNWVLHTGDDDTAIRTHVERDHSRPWMHRDEDDLVAEIRQRLLDGWTVAGYERE